MPNGGYWNVPMARGVKYEVPEEYTAAVKEAQRAARAGGRGSNSLSQLMSMVRMMNSLERLSGGGTGTRRGGTAKEREKAAAADRMAQAQRALYDDANFQERFLKAQTLSAQKAVDEVSGIKKDIVSRYATEYDVEPDQLAKIMMGGLQSRTAQRLKDVEAARGDYGWEGLWQGMKRFGRAAIRPFLSDEEADADIRKGIEERLEFERTNAYAHDQALRAQEGEGAWSRADGIGGMVANSAEAIGNMLPQVAAALGGRSAGAAIGAGIGGAAGFLTPAPGGAAAGAELGAQVGGLIGTALGGGTAGGLQGRYDYIERVLSDPNLTEEQKREALDGWGAAGATAANAALGAIPFGFRDAARLAAPRLGFTAAGKEVNSLAAKMGGDMTADAARRAALQQVGRRQLIEEAERGYLGNLPNSLKWGAIETGTMLGTGVPLNNAIYGSSTGQDVDLSEGLGEAAVLGGPLSLMLGLAGAKPRVSRAHIEARHPEWRKDGSIKPDVAGYREQFKALADNPDIEFGGRETSRLLLKFKQDYAVPESFSALVEGMEPKQREILKSMYDAAPQPRTMQSASGDGMERLVNNNPRSAAKTDSAPQLSVDEQVAAAREAFTSRVTDTAAWDNAKQLYPAAAKHVEAVTERLMKMDSKVREIYDSLRSEPTSVRFDDIIKWLAAMPDEATMRRNRSDIIAVLNDANNGGRDSMKGRVYSYEKLDGISELVRNLKSINGNKYGLAEMRDMVAVRSNAQQNATTGAVQTKPVNTETGAANADNQTLLNNAQQMVQQSAEPTAARADAAQAQPLDSASITANNAPDYVRGVGAQQDPASIVNYGKAPKSQAQLDAAIRKRYRELPDDFKQLIFDRLARASIEFEKARQIVEHQVGLGTLSREAADAQLNNYSSRASTSIVDALANEAANRGIYPSASDGRVIIDSILGSIQNDKKLARSANKHIQKAVQALNEQSAATADEPVMPQTPLEKEAAIDKIVTDEGANNAAGDTEQGLGSNDAAGAADNNSEAPSVNKPVETSPEKSGTDASDTDSKPDVRSDNATKSGGSGGSTSSDKRQGKAPVSNPQQARAEQQPEGTNPGRRVSTAADPTAPGSPRARGARGKNSGSKNEPKSQESNSGKQQADSKGVVVRRKKEASQKPDEVPTPKPEEQPKQKAPERATAEDENAAVAKELVASPDGIERLVRHIDSLADDAVAEISGIEINTKKSRDGKMTSNLADARQSILRAIFNTVIDPPSTGAPNRDKQIVTRLHDMSDNAPRIKADLLAMNELADSLYKAADTYRYAHAGDDGLPIGIDEAFAEIMTNEGMRTRLLDVHRADPDTNIVPTLDNRVPTVSFNYTMGISTRMPDTIARQFSSPVDTPARVYDAIRAITHYGDDLMMKITRRPNRNAEGSLRMNNVNTSQREMLNAYFKVSTDPASMTSSEKQLWGRMQEAGFAPYKFSETEMAAIENTAESLYNVKPEVYFTNQYFTGNTIDQIMNDLSTTIC